MNFGQAMDATKAGSKVTRAIWQSNSAYVAYANDDLTWQSIHHPAQHYHPVQADIFADDWSIIGEK